MAENATGPHFRLLTVSLRTLDVPTLLEALTLAQQALDAGDRARAASIYQQILLAVPEQPYALNGLGILAFHEGRLDVAADFFSHAIAGLGNEANFHNHLHLVRRAQGRNEEALACCRRAVELAPAAPDLHNNLGLALKNAGQLETALASLDRAVDLKPDYAQAHYNRANVLVQLRQLGDAERAFRRSIELAPNDCDTHNNLGTLLELQGRLDEAMQCYETALRLEPDAAGVHRNRALLRLLLGDYLEGFREYEWRWRMPGNAPPPCPQPRWAGERLPGGTILLIKEQGLGDTIQFIRFAALVKERSQARVVLLCPRPWHALLSTAPSVDQLVAEDDPQAPFDCYAPLLSLPAILGTTLETLPCGVPYLAAEPARLAKWRAYFEPIHELKVAIAWQGSTTYAGDFYRSIPLSQFLPLAECQGVRLFSLQRGFGHEQLAALDGRGNITDLGSSLDEEATFVDTAAAMKNLDLVITCDTAIAHLAGALSVPVWVALQYKPNWRNLLDRADSPWYPTMRLFRQPAFGDWAGVFDEIAGELSRLASARQK